LLPEHATITFEAGRFVVRSLDFFNTHFNGSGMITDQERSLEVGTILKFGSEGAGKENVIAEVVDLFAGEPSKFEPNLG
jgi:hypothetical protein